MSTLLRRTQARRGFTLIELLVAITVLSLVSLISWRGLESLSATRMRLEPEADDMRAMLVAFGQMELDYARIANPTFLMLPFQTVNVFGGDAVMLQIVRVAAVESDQAQALQVVVYTLKDGALLRRVSAPVRTPALLSQAPLSDATLVSQVRALRVRVWRAGQGWVDAGAGIVPSPDNPGGIPAGIEITLERNDGTRYRRVLVAA
jgi:general secretion pathway protein J